LHAYIKKVPTTFLPALQLTTSAILGRAIIRAVRDRRSTGVLEAKDINEVGAAA
jgi:hypothetical protein